MSSFDTLIVPEDLSDEAVAKLALEMGVSSVCRGIPSRLTDVLSAEDLPTVYTETSEESKDEDGVAIETRELSFDDTVVADKLVAVVAAIAAEAEVVADPEVIADPEVESDEAPVESRPE